MEKPPAKVVLGALQTPARIRGLGDKGGALAVAGPNLVMIEKLMAASPEQLVAGYRQMLSGGGNGGPPNGNGK